MIEISSHFMIPTLIHGRELTHNPLIARAVLVMVVDDPAGLQMGVDRHCTHILEATLLQIFAYPLGQAVTDRDRASSMALVKDHLTIRVRPDEIAEAAVLLTHLLIAPGIVNHRLQLARRPDPKYISNSTAASKREFLPLR